MRPYILAENNWNNLKDAEFELAVLPWGATEAHNYHMPYGSDIIESDIIAAESARVASERGAKVIVLPTIPFGVNTGQTDILLDINIMPSTQYAILEDVTEVLDRQGIYKLMILNSHGGNDFRQIIREMGVRFPKMFICQANWYISTDKKKFFENPGDHADEMETSLMLYLMPDLVLPREKWGKGREKKNRIKAFAEGWAWAERRWSMISEDTGVGNPELATRAKGEKYFKAVTEKIAALLIELCKTDIVDLYE